MVALLKCVCQGSQGCFLSWVKTGLPEFSWAHACYCLCHMHEESSPWTVPYQPPTPFYMLSSLILKLSMLSPDSDKPKLWLTWVISYSHQKLKSCSACIQYLRTSQSYLICFCWCNTRWSSSKSRSPVWYKILKSFLGIPSLNFSLPSEIQQKQIFYEWCGWFTDLLRVVLVLQHRWEKGAENNREVCYIETSKSPPSATCCTCGAHCSWKLFLSFC